MCLAQALSLRIFFAGIEDLHDVLIMLNDVSERWQELGLALGVFQPTLDNIRADYRYVNDCKREMLKHWLNQEVNCNWKSLAEALRSPTVNHKPIADAIEKKYCYCQY